MSKNKKSGNKTQKPAAKPVAAAPAPVKSAPQVKTPEKKDEKAAPKPTTKPATTRKVDPQVAGMVANLNPSTSTLDANHRVELMGLGVKMFHDDPTAPQRYGEEFVNNMNEVLAVGIAGEIAHEAYYGKEGFAAAINKAALPALKAACEAIGAPLNEKLLPAPKQDGTIEVPAIAIKPSKETKETLKEEEKLRNEKPELDVKKILESENPDAAHIAALKYLFIMQNGKGMIQTLSDAIEFEREYLIAKSNSEDATKRIKGYDHARILDHICREIQPTLIYRGIGRGLVEAYSTYGNLVGPFLIFRDAAVAKDGKSPYTDAELANIVKVMIKWICTTEVANTTKVINSLDKKNEKYKETVATLNKSMQHYKDILEGIEIVSYEYADKFPEYTDYEGDDKNLLNKKSIANKLAGRICKTYYGKALSKQSYKNLVHNIQQRVGVILNLFVDGSAINSNYAESNITELIEITAEEKVAARKAAAQEKAESTAPAEKAGEEGSKKE